MPPIKPRKRFITCEICGYRSSRVSNEKRMFMAKFPLDEARCKLWVKMVGKEDLAYVPIEKLHTLKYVCPDHFPKKAFNRKGNRLKKFAIPSINLKADPLPDEMLIEFPCYLYSDTDKTKINTSQGTKRSEISIIHAGPSNSDPVQLEKIIRKRCCVRKCKNEGYHGSPFSFYELPEDKILQFEWKMAIPDNINGTAVCSAHFKNEDFIPGAVRLLKPDAVPSIFTECLKDVPKVPKQISTPPPEQPADIQAVPSASRQVDEGISDTHDDNAELFDDHDVMIHDEVISDTEDEVVVPARCRDIQDEHHYDPKVHDGFSCNVCAGNIVGFRYVCVQCRDWDMCGTCEAAGSHAAHYVLRVPAPRAFAEMKSVLDAVRKALELSAHDPLYSGALLRPDAAIDADEIKSEDETEEWEDLHLTSTTDNFVSCDRLADTEDVVDSADEVHNESPKKRRKSHNGSTENHDVINHGDDVEYIGTLKGKEVGVDDSQTVLVKEGVVSQPATVRSVPAAIYHAPPLNINQNRKMIIKPIPTQLSSKTNSTEISRIDLTRNAFVAKCIAGVKRKNLMNTANLQPRVGLQRLDIPKGVFRIQVKRVISKTKIGSTKTVN